MGKVHLILGPVGSGKTTFGRGLSRERHALFLNMDEWMSVLFRRDRPPTGLWEWYRDRVNRCKQQIQLITESALQVGIEVILEIGLVLRSDRDNFFIWLDSMNTELKIYLLDAPREVRRERVVKRNLEKGATFSMEVPADIFELASDIWQPLADEELNGRNVEFSHSVAAGDAVCRQNSSVS